MPIVRTHPLRSLQHPLRRSLRSRAHGLLSGVVLAGCLATSGCALHPKAPPLAAQSALATFSVHSSQGQLSAADALQNGPLVVLFYRGHW